jgi:hypothetical protein
MYKTIVLGQLEISRKKLMELWDVRGVTDQEVLEAADEVDKWLNEYQKLSKIA